MRGIQQVPCSQYWMNVAVTITIVLLVVHGAAGCKQCTVENFLTFQNRCNDVNDLLMGAQNEYNKNDQKNNTLLCQRLQEFYKCVGLQMPNCLPNITKAYSSYGQTPYDCHLEREQILELQGYLTNVVCSTPKQSEKTSDTKLNQINVTFQHHVSDDNGQERLQGSNIITMITLGLAVLIAV